MRMNDFCAEWEIGGDILSRDILPTLIWLASDFDFSSKRSMYVCFWLPDKFQAGPILGGAGRHFSMGFGHHRSACNPLPITLRVTWLRDSAATAARYTFALYVRSHTGPWPRRTLPSHKACGSQTPIPRDSYGTLMSLGRTRRGE